MPFDKFNNSDFRIKSNQIQIDKFVLLHRYILLENLKFAFYFANFLNIKYFHYKNCFFQQLQISNFNIYFVYTYHWTNINQAHKIFVKQMLLSS